MNSSIWEQAKSNKVFKSIGLSFVESVPSYVTDFLRQKIPNIKYNKFNNRLAGHIQEQYNYSEWPYNVASFITRQAYMPELLHFHDSLKIFKPDEKRKLELESLWINLQKKYEFNPAHDHSGAFSFIIFLNIPYDINEELKYFPQSSLKHNQTSCLVFTVLNSYGKFQDLTIKVDKSFENKMLIFPAALRHTVYPFYTSDDYRITVSGNIFFKHSG